MVSTSEEQTSNGALVAVSEVRSAGYTVDGATLETQTQKVGLIYPPPDIRAIADKTALYVAKNGPEFERRIKANEAENAKFNFLKSTDPYHAYYQHKLAECSGKSEETAGAAAPAATAPSAPVPAPPARAPPPAVPPPTRPLEAPAEEAYTVHVPEGLTALDLDVIKLTAASVARNGKKFLTELAAKEHASPQFNFLKPTHSLFAFFTALCDAYSRVLMPPKGLLAELQADAASRARPLERALRRMEWTRAREAEARAAGEAEEADRVAMQQIDWHDFVVVETIDFFEDEIGDLPAPVVLRDVLRASRAAEAGGDAEGEEEEGAAGAARPAPMDAEEQALVAQAAGATGGPGAAADDEDDVAMEESDDEEEFARPVRIVHDYRRADPRARVADATGYVTSPVTGELVPVAEMAEHMRVHLLDPRWREQRNVMLSRIRETTRASDEEIGRNLASLARTMPAVFGGSEEEVSAAVSRAVAAEKAGKGLEGAELGSGGGGGNENENDATDTSAPAETESSSAEPEEPAQLAEDPAQPAEPEKPKVYPRGMAPPAAPGTAAAAVFAVVPRAKPPPLPPAAAPVPPTLPPPGMGPAPPLPEEPPAKRTKLDLLVPEEDWLNDHPGSAEVSVSCTLVEGHETLRGQTLSVAVPNLGITVLALKERLVEQVKVPANKQRISADGLGFLRDELSLAHYNVPREEALTLSIKERGGRRK